MKGRKEHDRGYRMLLSHPKVVEDLIRSFVSGDFVKDIDFENIEPYARSFIAEDYREREADVIWRVKVKERPVYFYILIELQSSVDRWMALRMLVYILLLYQDLIVKEKIAEKLPSVLPLLLYRGEAEWKDPASLSDLIEMPFEAFRPHVPEFSFLLIDEKRFSKESLLALESIMAMVFLVEKATMDDMAEIGRAFQEIYKKEVRPPLKRILKIWFLRKLRMSGLPTAGVNLDEGEVFKVLETNIQRDRDRLREEARREGREEGREKGRVEGRAEGRAEGMQAVARRMASMGEEIAKIALFTGLPEEEIKSLLNGSKSEE
ncbi:MAG: Rpn family recombination-promoting nuclease/putative transposase [Vulcanimicrobiota bacterium]